MDVRVDLLQIEVKCWGVWARRRGSKYLRTSLDLYFSPNIISNLIKEGLMGWTYTRDEMYTIFCSKNIEARNYFERHCFK